MSENVYQTRKRVALMGAQSRVEALRAEIKAIEKAFPGIQPAELAATIANQRQTGSYTNTPPVKKRTMSAAQRKLVSVRMKKYWADKRKAAKKAASNIG